MNNSMVTTFLRPNKWRFLRCGFLISNRQISAINNINTKIYISHCDVYDDALTVKNYLVDHGVKNVEIYFYDLITGAHIGPDSLALFYVGSNRD